MHKPSILKHQDSSPICKKCFPNEFNLISWNVHKNDNSKEVKEYIQNKKLDLILFQEASFKNNISFMSPEFSFDATANLEMKNKFFGVLTASISESFISKNILSEGKEVFLYTYKAKLLTSYKFEDESTLTVLNLHMINFRGNHRFNRELDLLFEFIKDYDGALIVAGDFNTWNKGRLDKLYKKASQLNLRDVKFQDNSPIKKFIGNSLDFVFYKGLEVEKVFVENVPHLSDHNPLFVRFKKI